MRRARLFSAMTHRPASWYPASDSTASDSRLMECSDHPGVSTGNDYDVRHGETISRRLPTAGSLPARTTGPPVWPRSSRSCHPASNAVLAEALAAARQITDESDRIQALAALVLRLPADLMAPPLGAMSGVLPGATEAVISVSNWWP
jgi:hypothetical protein